MTLFSIEIEGNWFPRIGSTLRSLVAFTLPIFLPSSLRILSGTPGHLRVGSMVTRGFRHYVLRIYLLM